VVDCYHRFPSEMVDYFSKIGKLSFVQYNVSVTKNKEYIF
jgi:hypothetical protein